MPGCLANGQKIARKQFYSNIDVGIIACLQFLSIGIKQSDSRAISTKSCSRNSYWSLKTPRVTEHGKDNIFNFTRSSVASIVTIPRSLSSDGKLKVAKRINRCISSKDCTVFQGNTGGQEGCIKSASIVNNAGKINIHHST